MKALLLLKCRQSIVILNNYGLPACRNDKKVTVVKVGKFSNTPLKNSKGGTNYTNYGNAVNRRRIAILEEAYARFNSHQVKMLKPWYKRLF